MKFVAVYLSVFFCASLSAQSDTLIKRNKLAFKIGYEIQGSDTLPVYLLNKYIITAKVTKTPEEIKAYENLVRWVRKALPYAKLAAFRLQMMEDNLNLLTSEKEKKKYVKECEKSIKTQFMDDLKNMYVEEGKILLKLIHRETGESTWDIMKDYGGTFEILLYQTMAKTYNADMKVTYDPVIDYQIEEIIKTIESENAK
ncbi:MAG: DUF4294 domain-containing protein [Chitinophagaceae bacterium]